MRKLQNGETIKDGSHSHAHAERWENWRQSGPKTKSNGQHTSKKEIRVQQFISLHTIRLPNHLYFFVFIYALQFRCVVYRREHYSSLRQRRYAMSKITIAARLFIIHHSFRSLLCLFASLHSILVIAFIIVLNLAGRRRRGRRMLLCRPFLIARDD